MLRRCARTSIATLRPEWLLSMLTVLAWLPAFLGPSVPALADDVILLSDSLVENEGSAELESVSEHDSAEFAEPPAVEPRETPQVGYDKGFYLRYSDAQARSFELKMNARIQLRHVAFSRDDQSWTDQAGVNARSATGAISTTNGRG